MSNAGGATGAPPPQGGKYTVYARSTTITAPTDAIERGIAMVRDEVLPAVTQLEGCVGLSMIVDRQSGQAIVTASWRDEEAMRNSAATVEVLRQRTSESLGAEVTDVHEWEVAVMHRAHPSADDACVRVTWLKGDPANVNRAVDIFKMGLLPRIEAIRGFCSASLLVDRTTGTAVSSITYDSREALENSRAEGASIRSAGSQETETQILDVREYELALAHLHLPEMA